MDELDLIAPKKTFAWRSFVVLSSDIWASFFMWFLAFELRLDFNIPILQLTTAWSTVLFVVVIQSLSFMGFGIFKAMWRFSSLSDLRKIVLAVGLSMPVVAFCLLMMGTAHLVPRSVWILDPILLVLAMGGVRFGYRAFSEFRTFGMASKSGTPVLIMGAGSTAAYLVKEFEKSPKWAVVGLLDDDPSKHNRMIYGKRVLGSLSAVGEKSKKYNIAHAVIAMPSASYAQRSRAFRFCQEAGIETLTVPSLDDILSSRSSVHQVRSVEIEDLLGREPVSLDESDLSNLIKGKTVLVTGAGGSIGAELCRQIYKLKPDNLILYDLSEPSIYHLDSELRTLARSSTKLIALVGDVKNQKRLSSVMNTYKPHIVFHAAAYKHVPLMEEENAWEAIRNNTFGTLNVMRTSVQAGVELLIMVSTDKAVNPTNIMGASKRLSEILAVGIGQQSANNATKITTVRFGNVLGSQGSVIPKFQEQIKKGHPITVTDPNVTRFFMSIPEACQLILQAALQGAGGEIFVLDMGLPIKIMDLAQDLIRLSGLTKDDVEILFTGLRPGEKLFEELFFANEKVMPTTHPKLQRAIGTKPSKELVSSIVDFVTSEEIKSSVEVRAFLSVHVEGYISMMLESGGNSGAKSHSTNPQA